MVRNQKDALHQDWIHEAVAKATSSRHTRRENVCVAPFTSIRDTVDDFNRDFQRRELLVTSKNSLAVKSLPDRTIKIRPLNRESPSKTRSAKGFFISVRSLCAGRTCDDARLR